MFIVYNGTNSISVSLYTFNAFYLFLAGLLLLVAMVGATVLTIEPARPTQSSTRQSYRKTSKSVSRSA